MNDVSGGSDKADIAFLAQICEAGVLRKEPEARMNGVRPHGHCGGDNALHIQIALAGRGRSDADGLICQQRVQGIPVRLRIDRHRLDAHFPAGPDHSHRDLASVCH